MKNFTKTITNKTLFKPTRWLIMALMMLVGTSSAWASTVYFINSLSWTDIKIYYWGNISVDWNDSPSMTKESYQINGSDVYIFTFDTDPQNIIFRGNNVQTVNIEFRAGEQWTPNNEWDNGKAKGSWSTYTPPCTKSVSNGTGNYSNGEITLSATYNTCGDAYIGFQWKKQGDEWCYTNDGTEKCYKALDLQNKSNEVVETSFTTLYGQTLSGTYVFRPYIVDGSDATNWIYGDEFEVITCSDPSAGYSISNENASVDWDGTEKEVIITTANGYATPSKINYDGYETIPTAVGEYTITIDIPSYGTYCAATDLEIGTFTITCPTIAAPAITESATVCAGTPVTLSNYNGDNTNTVKWYSDEECNSEVTEQVTLTDNGTKYNANYYAKAYHEASGCYSSEYSTLTFTVNPLPTISISGSEDAVLYEDVTLTAEATDGAEVKWYLGDDVNPVATGTTYTITSENAGEVTVKAKAFLGGCESDEVSYPVTFSAEDCTPDPSNNIQITFYHPTTYNDYDSQKGQWWGMGTMYYSTDKKSWLTIDMGEATSGSKAVTIQNITSEKLYVYFESKWTYHVSNKASTKEDIEELTKGNRYDIRITSHGNNNVKATSEATYTGSLSTPAPLSAPAVKTVSATSEEGSGVVNFTGKIIKTGCADNSKIYYGYQYRLETEDWPTTGVEASNTPVKGKLIPLTNASETALHYEFSSGDITLDNGKYVFRAYIINGYEFTNGNYDQGVYYGIDIPVTVSTKKYPIENLQIQYANEKGVVLQDQNLTYCVGDDAYIKLIYDGSRLKPEEDEINISSTLENTFTLVEGEADDLYTFVVKGNETITVNAKNKENTDNPTAELTINTYAVPVIPSIDIDKTTICSNDATGAKITVSNPQVGITYQVYKILGESEPTTHGDPKEYSEGVLEFNSMTQAGTYYVRAYNGKCPKAIAQSLDEILTVIDADATSISISPETKTVNPWVPVTFTVSKEGNYDYTFSCKEDENDVTSNMVINRSGDTYVVKFPKPDGVSAATDLNGQVTFADKTYYVEVKLNADVQCGTFNDESEVTLKPVNEICN